MHDKVGDVDVDDGADSADSAIRPMEDVAPLLLMKIWPMSSSFYPSKSFSRDLDSFHHRTHGGRQLSMD